jgi:hypothetical protein
MSYATVSSRQQLIDYSLRRLGYPVVEINVADEQISDRVDDALQLYHEYHSEGSTRVYFRVQITQDMIDLQYIDFDDIAVLQQGDFATRLLNIIRVLPIGSSSSSVNFFDIKYQMRLNDLWDLQTGVGDLAYYEQMQQYLSTIDLKLTGSPQILYTRINNRLYIFGDLRGSGGDLKVDDYIMIEAYVEAPLSVGTVYDSMFLKEFTTALVKKQWGENLSKFGNVTLPGGVTIDGVRLVEEADREIERIREKLFTDYDNPPLFFVG